MRKLLAVALFMALALASGTFFGGGTAAAQELQIEPVLEARFPVAIAWGPDGTMFFTERGGRIMSLAPGGTDPQEVLSISVTTAGETGLLGLEIDPEFSRNSFLYLFFTGRDGQNRVARYRLGGADPEVILEGLASAGYHNGGILQFAPDGTLFVSTGEAHDRGRAQNVGDIGGKILRIRTDGSPPGDNPFGGNSRVYAMGIRNAFGLALDPETKDLWETENGPGGNDEVNRILAGRNYGWPNVQCSGGAPRFEDAAFCFRGTIIPTQADFVPINPPNGRDWIDGDLAGDLYLGAFSGSIRRLVLSDDRQSVSRQEVFHQEDEGVVGVFYGPDGNLYYTTTQAIKRIILTTARSPAPTPAATVPGETPTGPAAGREPGSVLPWILLGILGALLVVALGLIAARAARGQK
jgi:glucose/arabinose dehydrogenase